MLHQIIYDLITARDITNKDDQISIDQASVIIHPTSTTEVEHRDIDTRTIVTDEATHIISCKEERENHAENPMQ